MNPRARMADDMEPPHVLCVGMEEAERRQHLKFLVGKEEMDKVREAHDRLGLSLGDTMRLFIAIGFGMVPVFERVKENHETMTSVAPAPSAKRGKKSDGKGKKR